MHEHDRSTPRNRLADETSPYLLQHAANPVDWYPWGPEAFAAARESGRPILLSIGYSACHWCHVMAHESFEDAATAAVMNSLFVNIKVDREERPDVDRIYQIAHQMLTQHGGGWPLTMFVTPEDQVPFFGGTYFPPVASHGMPAFVDLLQRVAQYHAEHRADIAAQNGRLVEVFDTLLPAPADASLQFTAEPLTRARAELATDFDGEYGGFTGTPKFPHPLSIERLLRCWQATNSGLEPDLQALYMATLTLTRMAEGGIYDQLGGGFARYSVDAWWMIPHFEKMLYDNGPLLALYAQAACATGETLFRRIANETADWALRDMQSPDGGFYSTLDADSEGHEGKFYVWRPDQVRALLTADEYQGVAPRFGLDRAANFEGQWHLHVFVSVEDIAASLSLAPAVVQELIDSARGKLLRDREGRIWPGRDEKILTAWNGLMIRGLAIASRCLQRVDLAAAATRAVDFLRANVWRDGRLYAVAKDGRTRFPAYLDDHAFLAEGLLELLQCRWRRADLDFLVDIVEVLLTHFEDREAGGFYFTADDAERLLHRSKSFGDDATPSGNGVIASVLGRLGHLLGETRYLQAAERVLRAGWQPLEKYPQGHGALLNALDEQLHPIQTLVIRGPAAESADWARELSVLYAPRRLVVAIPADATDLPPALATKAAGSHTVAYVCEGMTCGPPVASLAQLIRQLRSETRG